MLQRTYKSWINVAETVCDAIRFVSANSTLKITRGAKNFNQTRDIAWPAWFLHRTAGCIRDGKHSSSGYLYQQYSLFYSLLCNPLTVNFYNKPEYKHWVIYFIKHSWNWNTEIKLWKYICLFFPSYARL